MQERGDLIKDEEGQWIEGENLDWDALPARVEGVIEERIGRLEEELRETLTIASVEGETFTAQVVAQVQEVGERQILKRLSRQLEKQHRLILGGPESKVGEKLLSLYRFAHALYQRYLYNDLSAGERRILHRDVAKVLESFFEGSEDEICVQLAHHWEAAGEWEKTEKYLQLAGDQARLAYAHGAAITYYKWVIGILKDKSEWDKAARALMKLGLTYHTAYEFDLARNAYEEGCELWQRSHNLTSTLRQPPQAIIRYPSRRPLTLDPGLCGDAVSSNLISHIFSGLVELTSDLNIKPDLATSWEISEEGRRWLFHLRDDVNWSDGVPITAGDFEFAWKRNLLPNRGRNPAQLLYDVIGAESYHQGRNTDPSSIGVKALDERTFEIRLEKGSAYFLYILANHPVTFPQPTHVIKQFDAMWSDPKNLVSNGPFVLKDWGQKSISLMRNPAYHQSMRGNLSRIEINLMEGQSGLDLYESDQLDVMWLGPGDFHEGRSKHPDEHFVFPILSSRYIEFNLTVHPLSDPRVRRAFAMATDRLALYEVVFKGLYLPAKGGMIPPQIPGSLGEGSLVFDPLKAARAFIEAGFEGGNDFPPMSLLVPYGFEDECGWIVNQWRKILGVKIGLEIVDWYEWDLRINKSEFSMAWSGWTADYPDPDSFLRSSVFRQQTRWDHPEFEVLIECARSTMEQEKRVQYYNDADRIIVNEVPIIPLCYGTHHILAKPWVRSFSISPMETVLASDIIVEPY
jgi:oligopeptide transport system substrate-binding protein